jgi:nucleoside-diphosphate-sugar epimerase
VKPWVIVSGSSGLIGAALIERLARDFEVAALDIQPPAESAISSNVHFFKVDLGEPTAIRAFFQAHPHPIQGFVNLAGYYDFSNRPSIHYERLKLGLIEIARWYRELKTESSRFIQASSMACLEPVSNGSLIDANAQSFPRWEYPRFKKDSEDILRSELSGEHYVEMVIAGVYTDFCELVPLYHFLESHLRLKLQRWFYPGSGNQGLTYIHLDDVCAALQKQLSAEVRYRRLLLGESEATTYKQIGRIADEEAFGFRLPKIRVPKWLARWGAFFLSKLRKREFYQPWMIDFADEHYQFDLKATQEQLGWIPFHQLKNELPAMIRRARERPTEWRVLNAQRPWHADDWKQLPGSTESALKR